MPTSRQAVQSYNWTIVQSQAQELVVEVSQLALAKPAEPAVLVVPAEPAVLVVPAEPAVLVVPAEPAVLVVPAAPASAHWVALLSVKMACHFLAASHGAAETASYQATAVAALQAAAVEALQAE